ncbi:TPA: hypothetical protein OTT44_003750 [Enterobacter cloacae]|nr:hypothetical protein [Enterobacter cloacae]
MKMNINDILNQIENERETTKQNTLNSELFVRLSNIYDEMMASSILSSKGFQLVPPDPKFQILPAYRDGHISYTSGGYGSFQTRYYFYLSNVPHQPEQIASHVHWKYIGPRGGDHGDFTLRFETIEEGLKEFFKKILV